MPFRRNAVMPLTVLAAIVLALCGLVWAQGRGDAHPLGWNGIPPDQVIEIGKAGDLERAWTGRRKEAITRVQGWRDDNALGQYGVASVRTPDRGRFGPTDTVMHRDTSSDAFLAYWDANTSPDTMGLNTTLMANQTEDAKIGTIAHEILHIQGGDHPPAPESCETSLLAPFGGCGDYLDNTRRSTPGPHDTEDAIAHAEAGGWTDFSEIGSHPAAGDPGPCTGVCRNEAGDGEDFDPSVSVVERYGDANDTEAEALAKAEAAGVVFEWVPRS